MCDAMFVLDKINPKDFPEKLLLTYGRDTVKEWYEFFWKDKGVMTVRKDGSWKVVFINNGSSAHLKIATAKDPEVFSTSELDCCVKALKNLGFEVTLVNRGEIVK